MRCQKDCLNRRFARITGFHGFLVQRFYRFFIRAVRKIRLIRDSDKKYPAPAERHVTDCILPPANRAPASPHSRAGQ